MKRIVYALLICLLVTLPQTATAQQQFDVAFGLGTLSASPDENVTGAATLGGGFFPSFSADLLFKNNLGIQGQVAWRGRQNVFQGFQPYRPIFYDINGIYAPNFGTKFGAEVMGGIGALSTRVYQQFFECNFAGCTNYTSSNHLAGHVGGGLKFYVTQSFFVRPEAHFYFMRNAEGEYGTNRATRYGLSIGYTLRNEVY